MRCLFNTQCTKRALWQSSGRTASSAVLVLDQTPSVNLPKYYGIKFAYNSVIRGPHFPFVFTKCWAKRKLNCKTYRVHIAHQTIVNGSYIYIIYISICAIYIYINVNTGCNSWVIMFISLGYLHLTANSCIYYKFNLTKFFLMLKRDAYDCINK